MHKMVEVLISSHIPRLQVWSLDEVHMRDN